MHQYFAYVQYKEYSTKINILYLNIFCTETGTDLYNTMYKVAQHKHKEEEMAGRLSKDFKVMVL